MAALRSVLADHILTVPQRFLENTHKQDWILSLLVVGGSFISLFFFQKNKKSTTSSSNVILFPHSLCKPAVPASHKGICKHLGFHF